MVINGKAIAQDILDMTAREVSSMNRTPRLAAVTCAPNFETRKYLQMKTKKAAIVGVELVLEELPADTTTEIMVAHVLELVKAVDGIVVQLPLPAQIDRNVVLAAVPADKDPDGFAYGVSPEACLSPVVGAIDEISQRYDVEWKDKQVVVLGEGRLVGLPAAKYAEKQGSMVRVLTAETYDETALNKADIIVSGIGQSHFIKPHMVKDGVMIFDAGTSEDGGVLAGDVDPTTFEKAALVTPVPGGIGPITIAYLLRNLVKLTRQ